MGDISWRRVLQFILIPLWALGGLAVVVALAFWGAIFPIVLAAWILIALALAIPKWLGRLVRYFAETPRGESLRTVGAIAGLCAFAALLIYSEVSAR